MCVTQIHYYTLLDVGWVAEQLDQALLARWEEIAPSQHDTILAWLDSVSKEGAIRMLGSSG